MRKMFMLLCWFSASLTFAQKVKPLNAVLSKQEPEFMGGVRKFTAFISRNYRYPERLLRANVSGKTIVRFTVTEHGLVDSIRVVQSPGFGVDEEIIRILKLTSGKWKPGKIHGKAVAMNYHLPLNLDPE